MSANVTSGPFPPKGYVAPETLACEEAVLRLVAEGVSRRAASVRVGRNPRWANRRAWQRDEFRRQLEALEAVLKSDVPPKSPLMRRAEEMRKLLRFDGRINPLDALAAVVWPQDPCLLDPPVSG